MTKTVPVARTVTIVIPMYGDLPSLLRCIDSVAETVDLTAHRLLLINDCGPEADEIEEAVVDRIADIPAATYERNARNLGFVGTCNRAVYELDPGDNDILLLNSDARLTPGAFEEMLAVLDIDEKHGVVHPRSNNAAISSVPLLPLDDIGRDDRQSEEIYGELRELLDRYTVTPVAVGFCFLVRRALIRNYGFFDEAYAPGYSEENDFCFRVNRFGFSAVMANRAFVHHEGSKSFASPTKVELQRRNEARMLERYPYYRASVIHYLQFTVDPLDWFADRIFGEHRRRVLIDLYHVSLIYNGSTRNALSFLELLARKAPQFDIDFTIVSSAEAIEFFDLRAFGFPVIANGDLEETFDLGFALSPVSHATQINVLNRHCARWVVSHFDIISLRINHLVEVSFTRRQVVLDSLVWADRVIPISAAALDDLEAYFGSAANGVREHSTVIHEGAAEMSLPATATKDWDPDIAQIVQAGGYALVVGNNFSHKQLPEALRRLAGSSFPVVAFGSLGDHSLPEGVVLVEGGWLSDLQVDELYRNAACVVFPSSYEGFGLPIVETGQRDRPLVLFDMAVSREVVRSLGLDDLVTYFTEFDELPKLVDAAIAFSKERKPVARSMRSLDDYNTGILNVLLDELKRPVNPQRLRARVNEFRRVEVYGDALEERLAVLSALRSSPSYRIGQAIVRPMRPFRPAIRAVWHRVKRMRR